MDFLNIPLKIWILIAIITALYYFYVFYVLRFNKKTYKKSSENFSNLQINDNFVNEDEKTEKEDFEFNDIDSDFESSELLKRFNADNKEESKSLNSNTNVKFQIFKNDAKDDQIRSSGTN